MNEMNELVAKFESEFGAFEKRYDDYTGLSGKIRAQQNACKRDIKHYKMYIKMLHSKLAKYVAISLFLMWLTLLSV